MAHKPGTGNSCLSASTTLGAMMRSHSRNPRRSPGRVLEESALGKLGFEMRRRALPAAEQQKQDELLHKASISGSVPDLEAALAAGANPDARTTSGWTPLILAVWNERIYAARRLIAAGADVNAKANDGRTALMLASYKKDGSYLSLILSTGRADVDARDNEGWCALMLAAKDNCVENIRMLKGVGAERDQANLESALGVAERAGHFESASVLREHLAPRWL